MRCSSGKSRAKIRPQTMKRPSWSHRSKKEEMIFLLFLVFTGIKITMNNSLRHKKKHKKQERVCRSLDSHLMLIWIQKEKSNLYELVADKKRTSREKYFPVDEFSSLIRFLCPLLFLFLFLLLDGFCLWFEFDRFKHSVRSSFQPDYGDEMFVCTCKKDWGENKE